MEQWLTDVVREHNYNYHFKKWSVEKYTRKWKTDELFDEILDNYKHKRPPPRLTPKNLDKLLRRYKEKEKASTPDPVLKNLLQQMRDSSILPENSHLAGKNGQGCQGDEGNDKHSDLSMDQTSDESSESSSAEEIDSDFELLEKPSSEEGAANQDEGNSPLSIPRLRLSSSKKSAELEEVLRLTKAHYQAGILHCLRSAANTTVVSNRLPDPRSTDVGEGLIASLSLNKVFWGKVKSGIYYYKMGIGSEDLAIPLLQESSTMIPLLCEQQPFSIWKDIFATLSPVNIAVKPALLSSLLRTFTYCAHEKCAQYPDHPFPLICDRLGDEDLFREVSTAGLQLLHELSNELLPDGHDEIYEVERTLIRLLRRQGRLADSKRLSSSFVERSERLYGRCSVQTRLAMTELVYVLNDQGRYKESKGLAERIVERCRQDIGDEALPNQRCIYAMEDVAHICEKLGRMKEAISWLRRAQKDPIILWKDKQGTAHINRKLEAAYIQMGRKV